MTKTKKLLDKIDSIILSNNLKMDNLTIENHLGILIYFSKRFQSEKNIYYKNICERLLNDVINNFSKKELPRSFLQGVEGIYWTIAYLRKNDIIDNETILEDLYYFLYQSIEIDILHNNYDPLHGYIGKMIFILESDNIDSSIKENFVNNIIESLFKTKVSVQDLIYWIDKDDDDNSINLGLAHGVPSILVFLSRLYELGYRHQKLKLMIDGITQFLLKIRNFTNGTSIYPDKIFYSENTFNSKYETSRLGWCYGDLGVSYSLCYSSIVTNNNSLAMEIKNNLKKICNRGISDSGLTHFNEYSFFDIGFCHGLSGITFLIKKLSTLVDIKELNDRSKYWENELFKNSEIFLNIEYPIKYPFDRQNSKEIYYMDKISFLNGCVGLGMVLLSLNDDSNDWSKICLIY